MKEDIKLFYFLSCFILILVSIIIFCYIIKDLKITNDSIKKDINIGVIIGLICSNKPILSGINFNIKKKDAIARNKLTNL